MKLNIFKIISILFIYLNIYLLVYVLEALLSYDYQKMKISLKFLSKLLKFFKLKT